MTISTRTADERRRLRDRFRAILLDAAKERRQRENIIETKYGPEPEWARYERQSLLTAVNDERAARHLLPATADQIRNADSQAAGHVDYADKVSLYCAEIALGIERTVY